MARILVVDDSTVMRKNLCTILMENGHEVVGEAVDGSEAVLLYSELKPDLVTMDITMPRMNGVEAVNYIIKNDKNAKIIVISALNQKQLVFEALKNGAKHYVIKPIDPVKFLGIVEEVLEHSKKEVILKKEESNTGFTVLNIKGKFLFSFNKNLGLKDQVPLETAIKGLLFINPLNVVFYFEDLNEINDIMLQLIIKIGHSIIKSGGSLQYKNVDERVKKMLQELE